MTLNSKNNKLVFDKENLDFLYSACVKQRDSLTNSFQETAYRVSDMIGDNGDQFVNLLIRPLVNMVKTEEEMVKILKEIAFLKRLDAKLNDLEKKITVIETILDTNDSLHLATINFDELDIVSNE